MDLYLLQPSRIWVLFYNARCNLWLHAFGESTLLLFYLLQGFPCVEPRKCEELVELTSSRKERPTMDIDEVTR